MSCIPGALYQADAASTIPYVSAITKDMGIGRLMNASDRQQKAHESPAAQGRRPGGQISSAEWAARRHEITELYRFRGWTLARVMEEMARRGFHASKKQYKSKITLWKLDKNLRRPEVAAMLREKRRQESLGHACIFVSRGWLIDSASLERASKRAKLSSSSHPTSPDDDEDTTASNALPSDIRCIPLPSTGGGTPTNLTAPTDLETLRALFHYTSVLFHSFFDRDVTSVSRRDYSMLDASHDAMQSALTSLRAHDYARAGALLDSSFALFDDVVTSNHPNGLSVVLKTVGACYAAGFADIARQVATYARDMAGVRLDRRDPRWSLYQMLPDLRVGGGERGEGAKEVVGVYEVFCRDLWRRKRPGGGVLVLLWYPSMFCW